MSPYFKLLATGLNFFIVVVNLERVINSLSLKNLIKIIL